MSESGHNHYRTDGGPEPTGDDHDRMYPFCPMTGISVDDSPETIERNRHEVGNCGPDCVLCETER